MEPVIFRAVRPVFDLGILIGDRVVFDPNSPDLITRYRPVAIPNHGRVLYEIEGGALEPIYPQSPTPSVEEMRQAVGAPALARPVGRRGFWRGSHHLQILK